MQTEFRRALLRSLVAIAGVLVFGTCGYLLLDDGWTVLDAFYMTLITVTTIGYGEIRPLETAGRIFTSVLIVLGIGTAAAALTQIGSLLVESRLGALLGRRRIDDRLKKTSGHYLICGFGDLGAAIGAELDRAGVAFVVIDASEEVLQRAEALGFITVCGDPTQDATLINAGIRRAAGVVICAGDLATSLVVSMAGRELNPSVHIIAVGADSSLEERLVRAGADAVAYPVQMGGQRVARLIIEQLGLTPEDAPGAEEPGVFGYRVKLYRRYSGDRATALPTVGDIVSRTGAVQAVSLRRSDGSEIEQPAAELEVGQGDALALLVREGQAATRPAAVPPEWTEEMSLGLPSIDEEHRMLLTLISRISEATQRKSPRTEIANIFDRLIEYTERHFQHEEALFREHAYADAEVHAAQHRDLAAQVMELNRDRRAVLPANVSDFLVDWLRVHIMGSDHAYVTWLKERGVR
jgi:hemerythrin-like metal-binding protein